MGMAPATPCVHILVLFLLTIDVAAAASSLSFDLPTLGTLTGEGNTSTFSTYVELTISGNDPEQSAGHLFYPSLLPLWNSSTLEFASFNSSFEFEIIPTDYTIPGDGLAFVLIDPSSPDVLNTSKGQWLGLFNSSTNGSFVGVVAVEFDTFQNSFDPNSNHIGIDINQINSAVFYTSLEFTLTSSSSVFSWIDYSSSQTLLELYATNLSNTKPSSPLLSYNINLTQYLPESVHVGFSASTGSNSEYHRILSWSFNSTTIGNAAVTQPPPPSTKRGSNTGVLVGIGAGILVFAVIVLLGFGMRRRRKRRRLDRPMTSTIDMSGLPTLSEGGFGPRKFNYRDLVEATRNFGGDFLLGEGGFGPVYKGVLSEDGSEVAIKCISQKSSQGEKEFFAEVSIISRIRHKNLVQLKGWCRDKGKLLLVYEYLPNGSLDHHLFGKSSSSTLDWRTRYNIASGLGSALQYLHQECEKVIVHRDIKASNVMLDTNYNAKLGDFGLARQLGEGMEGHTTLAAGTVGYMAPEMYGTGRATPESDVYSYGITLLEVTCGRRPVDTSLPTQFEGRLLDWVWDLHSKRRLTAACDSRLEAAFDEEQLVRTLTVGLACSHPDPQVRPPIRHAVEALQGRVPLPPVPTFKPVAYYGPPLPSIIDLVTTSSTYSSGPPISSSSSGPPISSSSSARDSDATEKPLLFSQ